MLHKLSGRSHAQFMHMRVPKNKACWCYCLVNTYIASLHLHIYLLLLQVIFTITQNQLVMPEMQVSAHASTLIEPGYIWVTSGSDPDYYLGQWVIWVSDTDTVSTL